MSAVLKCDTCGKARKVCCSAGHAAPDGTWVREFTRCAGCCGPHGKDYAIDAFLGLVNAAGVRR